MTVWPENHIQGGGNTTDISIYNSIYSPIDPFTNLIIYEIIHYVDAKYILLFIIKYSTLLTSCIVIVVCLLFILNSKIKHHELYDKKTFSLP